MSTTRPSEKPKRTPDSPGTQGEFATSLYQELHRLAARRMRFERANHTLQPTALVNEAYLRLADLTSEICPDRVHFLAAAAQVMRHILVDHARSHNAAKRVTGGIQVTLDDAFVAGEGPSTDVLAIDEAMKRLSELDPRQARITEMHFFAGMTFEEIAAAMEISPRTAKRDWAMARAWLHRELSRNI